jgi:hypothetical protein
MIAATTGIDIIRQNVVALASSQQLINSGNTEATERARAFGSDAAASRAAQSPDHQKGRLCA